MANIQLPGLPSSIAGADTDLYHTRQGSTDKTLTGEKARQYFSGIIPWAASFNFIIGQSTLRNNKVYEAKTANINKDPDLDDGTDWTLKYTNFVDMKSGRKNYLINGDFDIWQRGVSFVGVNSVYTADRMLSDDGDGTATVTQETFTLGQTDVPDDPKFFLRHDQTSATTIANSLLSQRVEGVKNLANTTIIVSLYLKVDSAKTFAVDIQQNFGTGGSPSASVTSTSQNVAVTTAFQKFDLTFIVPSISGKTLGTNGDDYLAIRVREESGFTTFTLDFSHFQVEEGEEVTNFEFRPIAEELALCQRYYQTTTQTITGFPGFNSTTNLARVADASFSSEMRTIPTVTVFPNAGWVGTPGASSISTLGFRITADADVATAATSTAGFNADAEL